MAANEASVAVSEETLEGCALVEDEKKKITPPEKEVLSIFSNLQDNFELEQDLSEQIRSVVRELEQKARGIYTAMQEIHQCSRGQIPELCSKVRQMFVPPKTRFDALGKLLPKDAYYKFNDHWRFVVQRLSFLASFLMYLERGVLAPKPDVALLLGVSDVAGTGLFLELDDYLMGILTMCNELSRLAVNSVILEDYKRPFEISTFISDVIAGFRLLNLKNDNLRKKFDALKYDVKKVEEVVYDISIRGMKPEN